MAFNVSNSRYNGPVSVVSGFGFVPNAGRAVAEGLVSAIKSSREQVVLE